MSDTQSESIYEQDPAERAVAGALLVFSGTNPQLRTVVVPTNAPTVFGRDDAGGSALPDPRVSAPHCELSFDGQQFSVTDLGSRNGTWVDGVKLEPGKPQLASSGSVLRLAQTLFLLCDNVRPFQAGTVATGERVIGPTYRAALEQVAMGARGGATVLIIGENGSGKELLARTFHATVGKSGPFIAVNCAAIPPTLAESLLFGTVKGIHNDAKDTRGYVREANGGTLFLDEVAELDLKVQAKLLRVIEHNEVMVLGASTYVKVQVRIVSATNCDLKAEVEAKTFREDLYYRLAQFPVRVPPLRERKEELPWLIAHALGEQAAHPSLVEQAMIRPWPGNVRELMAQMKKAAALAKAEDSPLVREKHLDPTAGVRTGQHPALKVSLPPQPYPSPPVASRLTAAGVVAALEANDWNIAATMRALGIPNRTTLVRLISKFKLERPV